MEDEEKIPLIDRYENNDDSVYQDAEETSFSQDDIIQQEATEAELCLREQNIEKKDRQIKPLEREFNVKIPPEERVRFRLSSGFLQVEISPGEFVNVTKSNGKHLAASTLRTRLGASLVRSLLGIKTPTLARVRSRVLLQDIPTEIETDELPPQKLKEVISKVTREMSTNTDLDMREFSDIDKALTRISGELANNIGKLTEIDKHLEREHTKLDDIKDDQSYSEDLRDQIKKRIADLKKE